MTLSDAYDPEAFRAAGHRLIDELATYLQQAREGDMPVLPVLDPDTLLHELSGEFPAEPGGDLVEMLMQVVRRSNHLHHPRYVGHQVSMPVPQAVLAEMVTSLLNNGMAIWEMGQAHTVMERHVIAYLASAVGFPDEADGVLTNGGSLGNLTALLAARQAKAGYDVWTEGQREPWAVLVSDQAHYCIARAVQCMGWGADGAVAVPTDERFRMRVSELEACLRRAESSGRKVLAVVASSCSTATGSFDPLSEIADFCGSHDLWLHVDGAHGASLALSEKYRDRLTGIERADSVVWDLHKLMALPALNTAVLFRDGQRSYEAFAQEAGYLYESERSREQWYTIGLRTLECTKRGMGVTAYCTLQTLGTRFFESNVDRLVDSTQVLAGLLEEADDFELATWPEANIVCFRHLPAGGAAVDLDAHQARIRRSLVEGGRFYLVQTPLRGSTWLRVTMMNPFTSESDLAELVEELRRNAGTSGTRGT